MTQECVDELCRRIESTLPAIVPPAVSRAVVSVLWTPLTLGLMARDLDDWLYPPPSPLIHA